MKKLPSLTLSIAYFGCLILLWSCSGDDDSSGSSPEEQAKSCINAEDFASILVYLRNSEGINLLDEVNAEAYQGIQFFKDKDKTTVDTETAITTDEFGVKRIEITNADLQLNVLADNRSQAFKTTYMEYNTVFLDSLFVQTEFNTSTCDSVFRRLSYNTQTFVLGTETRADLTR